MEFRVLGPAEVVAEGRRSSIGSDRQRVILAVLLVARGRVVSADRLIDAVWGEKPPASAHKSLHSHVCRLRGVLAAIASDEGAKVVVTEPDGYRLALELHDMDADRFEALVAQARHDLVADPERTVSGLDEALGLWRGEAFGELASHEVIQPEAVRLERLRAAAIADRVDARLAIGEHQAVIAELEATVVADPLADRPHAQLMLALYRSGRQADALAVFRRLQDRLVEAIGVDPSPEVQELHVRILRQDADLTVPARPTRSGRDRVAPPEREAEPPVSPMDPSPESLIGRDEDVAAVAALVSTAPLVTLTGPGGVGKTRLAEAVVAEVSGRFDDGVVWCGLAPVADPASVVEAVVGALGLQHRGDRSPLESVLTALGTRRLLLVLDGCEHLLEAVAHLTDRIRGACPRVAVLATSREYLHLPGERVWEVTPLPVPRREAGAREVAETPAGALLCVRARAVEPSFALTDDNAAAIAELCRRLDGIPLAIELAAACLRALTPADLAQRLDHRFEVLTGGPLREAGRHRTLQAVVAWSYDVLTEAEARLFDRLSVFAGPFSLAGAEQVCAGEPLPAGEVAGVLAELVDRSMVSVDRAAGRGRYRLLDTLRAYGEHRLEETGAAERMRRAHALYHVRLAEQLGPQVRGAEEHRTLEQISAAIDDLRVAHGWLVDSGDLDGALRLPAALHEYLVFRPRAEMYAWAERALELPGAQQHPAYPAALVAAARGAMNRGEFGRTRRDAEAALARVEGDDITALQALYLLTNVALYEGRLDDVLALADRRIRLAEELRDHYHRALAGVSRVLGHMYRGDADAAGDAAAEARRVARASGNHTAYAWALYSSGEALLDSDPAQATILLEQAIEAARRVDRRFIEGVALVSLASLCGRTGDARRALELFHETVAHWRRLGDYTHQLTTLRNLVELLTRVHAELPAAVLYGAVTTADATPSFGAEAGRLAAAWAQLEQRLGLQAAQAAAERGRQLTPAGMVDAALAELDTLLGETAVTQHRAPS